MFRRVLSGAVLGIEAFEVFVEVDHQLGQPNMQIVGLPDSAVKEARNRIESAVRNSGFELPASRVVINLAPADIRKIGTGFDLPMALALVFSAAVAPGDRLEDTLFLGELSLDGSLRPVSGVLPIADLCRHRGIRRLVVPFENASEAAVVPEIEVYPARQLRQVVEWVVSGQGLARIEGGQRILREANGWSNHVDFSDIKGQEFAKRALEVAAAGGHNVFMIGPPGSGKTMLAKRLPTILPPMSFEEAVETTKVYSVMGLVKRGLITRRPFRNPHHTISDVALIGGGSIPRPGEISLAHNGVLFLDEFPEFRKNVLEALRQPLEDGEVVVSRASMSVRFPARIMLVAAANPCPCGYSTDPRHVCVCSPHQIRQYRARISGPVLDRIDIHVEVPALSWQELDETRKGESSALIRERVIKARAVQQERFRGMPIYCNAQMTPQMIREFCQISAEARRLLERAVDRLGLSARAFDRILKVARTIADLDGAKTIEAVHLSEAVQYRALDRRLD